MAAKKPPPPEPLYERMKMPLILGVIAVMSFIGPTVSNFFNQWQSKADADRHAQNDDMRFAWLNVGMANIKTTLMDNRAADCDARDKAKKLSPPEQTACEQFKKLAEKASKAEDKARDQATLLTRKMTGAKGVEKDDP